VNVMNMNKNEDCSNSYLPEELWAIVFKKLKTTLDVVRFRSTCSLWHSFLPPTPLSHDLCIPHQGFVLLQTKIYRIQPSFHDHEPSTSSSCSNKGWLIKVSQNSNSFKFYLFDLFTNKRLPSKDKTTHKVMNLMNVRVVELFELYNLCRKFDSRFKPVGNVRKVILFSVEGRLMVFALYTDKKLKVSNIGKQENTMLKDDGGENKYFDDIMLYKGQLYVLDKMGTIFWINAFSLKLVQFSPKNFWCGEKSNIWKVPLTYNKQLVEFDGNLYVVDLYIDGERFYKSGHILKAICVEVYKLDQEWGKWLDVKDLGDVSFVLGKDSNFALLARDYYRCEGNCIYFYCENRTCCFNLENLEAKPANIF